MKQSTPDLMKFRRLERSLGDSPPVEPKTAVVGILERLWLETAKQAPAGDIGKFTNEEIAILCGWRGEPDDLVILMIDTGWIDRHPDPAVRLIVHDWEEHCPAWLRQNMKRHNREFVEPPAAPLQATVQPTVQPTVQATKEAAKEAALQDALTKPNQAKSNQVSKGARFKPPSVAQVAAYCQERGNGIDAAAFVAHYEAGGWMRGKTKIKDWRACVRTWEGRQSGGNGQGIDFVGLVKGGQQA